MRSLLVFTALLVLVSAVEESFPDGKGKEDKPFVASPPILEITSKNFAVVTAAQLFSPVQQELYQQAISKNHNTRSVLEVPKRTYKQTDEPSSYLKSTHVTEDDRLRVESISAMTRKRQAERQTQQTRMNPPSVTFQTDAFPFPPLFPGDPTMDISNDHIIVASNAAGGSSIAIYDKAGNVVMPPSLIKNIGPSACSTSAGDPQINWDKEAQRWVMMEFGDSSTNTLCFWVSQTSDAATTSWNVYEFQTPNFPDYLKLGVGGPEAYYVATNEGDGACYAFNKPAMLAGNPLANVIRLTAPTLNGFNFQAFQPTSNVGNGAPTSTGLFLRHRDDEVHGPPTVAGMDFVEVWQLIPDFNTPLSSTLAMIDDVAVEEFSSDLCGLVSFSCFAQPGPEPPLDPLREVVMQRPQYYDRGTYEQLILTFTGDANGADQGGVIWKEFRRTGGPWTLEYEEMLPSGDGLNRWMGAIAVDGSHNIALMYAVGSSSVFPGLRFSYRYGDVATMEGEVSIIEGTKSSGSVRWGDYFAISADPTQNGVFWGIGMYGVSPHYAMRLFQITFDVAGQCAGTPEDCGQPGSCASCDIQGPPQGCTNQVCTETIIDIQVPQNIFATIPFTSVCNLLHPPSNPIYGWTVVSQPVGSSVDFSNQTTETTTITLSLEGDYVIQCEIDGGNTKRQVARQPVSNTISITAMAPMQSTE